MMNRLKLSKGCSARGADMGRPDNIPSCVRELKQVKLRLEKLQWVDFDYDKAGCYWGNNGVDSVYCAWGTLFNEISGNPLPPVQIFVWAKNREDAKQAVKIKLANVVFYR